METDRFVVYQEKESYLVAMTDEQRLGHLHPVIFRENAGIISGRDVLDIGCNKGDLTLYLDALAPKSLCGADVNTDALDVARTSLPGIRFEHCPAHDMPFDDNAFDTVVMFEVIEHLYAEDKAASLAEVSRVLRPGGLLFISTPKAVPGSVDEKAEQNAYDPHHVSFYLSEADVNGEFKGWECVSIRFEGRPNPGNKSQKHCSWIGIYRSPKLGSS